MSPHEPPKYRPLPSSWLDYCNLSDEELCEHDIAAMNLACSAGLPGAEVIDVPGCLKACDDWAKAIRRRTEERIETEFRQHPEKFEHSEPIYRMVKMVNLLQEHCGVRYDPAKRGAKPSDPFDLHEHFIYGPIQGPGGTCATLPVLYAAVGRRMGYPVRLVLTPGHMFCRWDDPLTGIRMNIEGACDRGLNNYPDEHYRKKWPRPFTPVQERTGGYLYSLTPREELAVFVSRRGRHWQEMGNYRRAACAYLLAGRLDTSRVGYPASLHLLETAWDEKLRARRPPGFPKFEISVNQTRRRWPGISWDLEKRLRFYEAVENVLNDPELEERWWTPLREGKKPGVALPGKIVVDCTGEELCLIHP